MSVEAALKDILSTIILKDEPTIEDRVVVARYLRIIGGCPHLHKWHNPGYADSIKKCLDCGEEDV